MRNGKMKSVRILWTFRQEHVSGRVLRVVNSKKTCPGHDGVKYAIPVLHLYWRAENSNEWYYFVVMRIICSTAIIQEIIYGMKRRIIESHATKVGIKI